MGGHEYFSDFVKNYSISLCALGPDDGIWGRKNEYRNIFYNGVPQGMFFGTSSIPYFFIFFSSFNLS